MPEIGAPVTIRMLGPSDAALFGNVAEDVFDNAIDPLLSAEFLADPRHHMALALNGERVVGIASAVHYVHPDKAPQLWINEVGVAPSHQQQGIGRRLVDALLAHARTLGCSEAWVGTEDDNAAARRLYAAAGGEEAIMVFFSFKLDR